MKISSFLKGIETRLPGRPLCSPAIIVNELICLHFHSVLLKLKPMLKYGLYFELIRLKTAFEKKKTHASAESFLPRNILQAQDSEKNCY
jgi:hypothetical protein